MKAFACLLALPLALLLLSAEAHERIATPSSSEELAALIWTAHGARLRACKSESVQQPNARIAQALVAIELHATSRLEHVLERVGLEIALITGAQVPNWSLGIAQIRPRTLARATLAEDINLSTSAQALVSGDCSALNAAQKVVSHLKHRCPANARESLCALIVARGYNGQGTVSRSNLAYLSVFEALLVETAKNQR
ncbi:MAG: hypothetical protein AAGH60_14850 [Pseudomonadota bacterium]